MSKDGFAARAGEPLRLRDWQKQLLLRLFARRPDGRLRHRVALIGMPRKNGKSAIGSGLALDGLLFGGAGAEVYSAAAEKEQARIVFGETKRMVESLKARDESFPANPMKDVIEGPDNSIYRVLSAEAYSKEGLNITRALVDELHAHATDDLWNVLTLASAARIDPLVIAITTAGIRTDRLGRDTVCYRLYKHGIDVAAGRVDDPSFFFAWWGAPEGSDHTDPEVWKKANPGFGDLIDPEDFASAVLRTPEAEFRTKRLNMWVESAQVWLPGGTWDACRDEKAGIPDGTPVVLGFDGSFSGDSTALVAATGGEKATVIQLGCWEKSEQDGPDWRAPRLDIMETIRQACKRWRVLEVAADPYIWQSDLETLAEEGIPVVEFPQHAGRMIPATQRFYELVMARNLAHRGDADLDRHVGNAVLKTDARGSRLAKEAKRSTRHIDLAVAAVMAVQRASELAGENEYTNLLIFEPDEPTPIPGAPRVLTQDDTTAKPLACGHRVIDGCTC